MRLLRLGAVLCFASLVGAAAEPALRSPVLVELFTSEGCSSCPPADALLAELDRQSASGIIVLSEHVDYWNQIGWTDPFSSHFFSQRQETYVDRLRLDTAYTPQAIVDGSRNVLGSDRSALLKRIQECGAISKSQVQVSAKPSAKPGELSVIVDSSRSAAADVFVVLARNQTSSSVLRGENRGQNLKHVAVVHSITKIGSVKSGESFRKEMVAAVPKGFESANLRVVAFLQEPRQGKILGSAVTQVAQ